MILNALSDTPLPLYGDGLNVRDWIHVDDHCAAIERVLEAGREGEVYNVGGRAERPNLEIVRSILKHTDKPESLIRFVADRPGHDRRYAIDDSKIERELGWTRLWQFDEGPGNDGRMVSRERTLVAHRQVGRVFDLVRAQLWSSRERPMKLASRI